MDARSWWQRMSRAISWRHARPVVLTTCAGMILGLSTVTLSAINAISAQQAIAMALPAMVTSFAGLTHILVLDSRNAWRRGFQQGCQAGLPCRLGGMTPDITAVPDRDGVAGPARLVPRERGSLPSRRYGSNSSAVVVPVRGRHRSAAGGGGLDRGDDITGAGLAAADGRAADDPGEDLRGQPRSIGRGAVPGDPRVLLQPHSTPRSLRVA